MLCPGVALTAETLLNTNVSTAQVETLLKGQDPATAPTDPQQFAELSGDPSIHVINKENPVAGLQAAHDRRLEGSSGSQINTQDGLPTASDTLFNFGTFDNMPIGDTQNMENITMGWDLMSMGVEEPLPSQETQDALYVSS